MPTAAQRAQAKRLVALYDYEPTLNDTDIRLTRGEVVFGVELQGEWWWGYNTKRSGIFPANFVQEDGAMAQAANSSSNGAEEEQEEQEDVIRCQAGNPSSDGGADGEAAGPPPSPPRTRRGRSNGPGASGGAAAAKAEEEEEEEDGSEGGPDPFSGEVDDEEVSPPTQKFEHKQQQSTLHSIPGLNVQWVISDNLKCAHTLLLWNGNFSNFVKSKLLLTDNFLVEAVYFTPDLPEVSVYPLHKLYIDPRQKIDAGFLKRGYLTFRSQYYFCNLSTTAFGGGHNELVSAIACRAMLSAAHWVTWFVLLELQLSCEKEAACFFDWSSAPFFLCWTTLRSMTGDHVAGEKLHIRENVPDERQAGRSIPADLAQDSARRQAVIQ